ncbi:MAG: CheR family methyltransferase [Rubripirellula sp.]
MAIQEENFEFIRQALYQRSAIALTDNKQYLVETRLAMLARKSGMGSVDEYVEHLKHPVSPVVWQDVVDAMTTNETSFFRDGMPFNVLRDQIFKSVISKKGDGGILNVWSAACSSGQEPYSIAMLWNECQAQFPGWELRIIASDISKEMLSRAELGVYTSLEIERGLSKQRREKFFHHQGDQWRINESLRKKVEFRYINLIDDWPVLPLMDVVFIRNVLVYFDLPTKQELFAKLRSAMKPDGVMFLGGAETTLTIDDQFERVFAGVGNCYRMKKVK